MWKDQYFIESQKKKKNNRTNRSTIADNARVYIAHFVLSLFIKRETNDGRFIIIHLLAFVFVNYISIRYYSMFPFIPYTFGPQTNE